MGWLKCTAIFVLVGISAGWIATKALGQDAGATQFISATSVPMPLVNYGQTVFYLFTTVEHSAILRIRAQAAKICLNTDQESTADSGARVRIRSQLTAATAAGSVVIGDTILDGIAGSAPCLNDVPSGLIYVEVVAAPGGAETAVVSVYGHDGGAAVVADNQIPFHERVALGQVYTDGRQWQVISKFGQNSDIDIGIPEDVWDCPQLGADLIYPWLEAATTLYISSDDDLDAAVTTVLVDGLDANWDRQQLTAVLGGDAGTGTTSVQIGGTDDWIAVNSVQNVGAAKTVGNVYVHNGVDAGGDGIPDDLSTIRGCWLIGFDRSEQMVYAVPRDHTALLYTWRFGVITGTGAATKSVSMHIIARLFGGVDVVVGTSGVMTSGTGLFNGELPLPAPVPAKTRLSTRALDASANNTHVFSALDIVLAPQ